MTQKQENNRKKRSGKKPRRRGRRKSQSRATSAPRPSTPEAPPLAPDAFMGEPGGLRSLELLRERIEAAADEIHRLRQENAELAERMVELERMRGNEDVQALLTMEASPEQLKEKIQGFIEAIDRYLALHDEEDEAPEDDAEEAPLTG